MTIVKLEHSYFLSFKFSKNQKFKKIQIKVRETKSLRRIKIWNLTFGLNFQKNLILHHHTLYMSSSSSSTLTLEQVKRFLFGLVSHRFFVLISMCIRRKNALLNWRRRTRSSSIESIISPRICVNSSPPRPTASRQRRAASTRVISCCRHRTTFSVACHCATSSKPKRQSEAVSLVIKLLLVFFFSIFSFWGGGFN